MFSKANVILTRPREEAIEFADALRRVVDCQITIWPLRERHKLDVALPDLGSYNFLIFSAKAGVDNCTADLSGSNCLAIGERTAVALRERGAEIDQIFLNSEALLQSRIIANSRCLVIGGRPSSVDWACVNAGDSFHIDEVVVYTTCSIVSPIQIPAQDEVAAAIFPVFSKSSWDSLATNLDDDKWPNSSVVIPFSDAISSHIVSSLASTPRHLRVAVAPLQPSRGAFIAAIQREIELL